MCISQVYCTGNKGVPSPIALQSGYSKSGLRQESLGQSNDLARHLHNMAPVMLVPDAQVAIQGNNGESKKGLDKGL